MEKTVSAPHFESELRISPIPIVVMLVLLGVVLGLGYSFSPQPSLSPELLVILLYVVSATTWLLNRWKPLVSRWFLVITSIVVLSAGNIWLDAPGVTALSMMPPLLAAALLGLPSAAAITAVETALIIWLWISQPVALDATSAGIALCANWLSFGLMVAVYQSIHPVADWSWSHYQQAQESMDETRNRKAELEETLQRLVHANRQLALSTERTASLREIAEEARKAKTAFVASVSHELRTPLNMIIGLVDLMIRSPGMYDTVLSPKMREDLEVVHRNCVHLSSMINDVLDLTRMESGRMALHKERVNLKEVITRSTSIVRPLLEKKQITLEIDVPDDLPAVYCDYTRIQQVTLNLLSNAARFTEKGRITIRIVNCDSHVTVSIEDTGSGISPEDAEKLFQPFWQSQKPLWRDGGGSGLGLSISKHFVGLHKGRMWVESELGSGTAFHFTLPVSPPMEHTSRPGHQIRGDWIWKEQAFRTNLSSNSDELVRPRVIVCDQNNAHLSHFARYYDDVEIISTTSLVDAAQELQKCPAHALMLNMADTGTTSGH